jgi:hypothetical protein
MYGGRLPVMHRNMKVEQEARRFMLTVGSKVFMGCMAIVLMSGAALVGAKDIGTKEERRQLVEMATAATVTIEQAIKIGLDNFPGKVIEAELEKKRGQTAWEIEILTMDREIMKVHIDAMSGSVIDTEETLAETQSDREHAPKRSLLR